MEQIYNEIKTKLYQDFYELSNNININIDIIHNIRLNFKKIKAFYKMFDFIHIFFHYKIEFEHNKNFYKILGQHRDNEIMSEYVKEFMTLEPKDNLIKDYLRTDYIPSISDYKFLTKTSIHLYLEYLFNSIDLDSYDTEEELHDQRKIIKDYYYISTWIGNDIEAKDMKELSDLLGEWHDRILIIDNLNEDNDFINNLNKEAKDFLKKAKLKFKQILVNKRIYV